jgi:hypothetical protein
VEAVIGHHGRPPTRQPARWSICRFAWKEKFREIAFFERRKENDLSLEAFRDFLLKKGHKVD